MSRITEAFHGLWNSLVRTYVPWIVGAITGWLVSLGVPLDPEVETQLALVISGLAGAVYYAIIRVVEKFAPRFGWLRGSAKQPVYSEPGAVEEVEAYATAANEAVKHRP